jgi:hypothetical protein
LTASDDRLAHELKLVLHLALYLMAELLLVLNR